MSTDSLHLTLHKAIEIHQNHISVQNVFREEKSYHPLDFIIDQSAESAYLLGGAVEL